MEDRSENLIVHRLRPRLQHARRDRGHKGRQDPRPSGPMCWPTMARSTARRPQSSIPAGFFGVFTGSYDLEAAYCKMTAVYTNKAPGGVAYACSFRITEAVYLVERMVDCLAFELGMDPTELRMQQLHPARAVPLHRPRPAGSTTRATTSARCGWPWRWPATTSCAASRPKSGRGASSWASASPSSPRPSAPGPARTWTSWASAWPTVCELRVHPTGKAVVRLSVQTQGQGHETTFAQIVAEEIGIPPADIEVVHGDTDQTPFGLGTYGSRSTPVSGAAAAAGRPQGPGQGPDHRRRPCSRCRPPTSSGRRARGT